MPHKVVQCALCGEEGSKKTTLSLEALGSDREGRACRHHDEVKDLQKQQEEQNLARGRKERRTIIVAAVGARVLHSIHEVPEYRVWLELSKTLGLTPQTLQAAQRKVEEMGGLQMTDEEILDNASDPELARRFFRQRDQ